MFRSWFVVFVATLVIVPEAAARQAPGARSCESLATVAFPDATITMAQLTPPGTFVPPGAAGTPAPDIGELPAFCRVGAMLRPAAGSEIRMEVWLPAANWNGKFMAVGNGGWAGVISFPGMSAALRRGYAVASTDTGHVGNTAVEMLSTPDKLLDYAYRAVHEMTVTGKAMTTTLYGSAPRYSYWNGCSTGGRQGLQSALMFPGDFDGVIAGAPAIDPVRHAAGRMRVAHAAGKDAASYIPPAKYPMIHRAVVLACDAIDGLQDGLIDDPRRCTFDPAALACQGEDRASCLTPSQVETAKTILSPVVDSRTGAEYLPRIEPGAELRWDVQAGPQPYGNSLELLRYVVFKDPQWDWRTFNFASHLDLLAEAGGVLKATDPNLRPFVARGGKLLMYHGWSDPTIVPQNTITYYARVLDTMGGASQTADWLRLFMVPGMLHCTGGDGPNAFDTVTALERWVEQGMAPDRLTASHSTDGRVDRTRPLCPYPQVARHTGTGSIDDAANFACRAP